MPLGRARDRTTLTAAALVMLAGPAAAQTYTVTITDASDLGSVVSAASGDTVFTIDPASGAVTRASGSGVRMASASTRAVVSVTCDNQGTCNNGEVSIKIGSIGSPTNRARTLTNFGVAMNTAALASAPTGANPISFVLEPIAKNTTKTFYVGFDHGIAGDNSGLPTGHAGSGFYVYASGRHDGAPTSGDTATATATAYRPISMTSAASLVFGTAVRPPTGGGAVTISALTGERTVSGEVIVVSTPLPSRASYAVTGEGGQSFSISMPATLVMTSAGDAITAALTLAPSGHATLNSSLGSSGVFAFHVGGQLPLTSTTKTGAYAGTFAVTVQYD